jgi:anti-sigma regulatory factor (Ser/Thr protein kinase)
MVRALELLGNPPSVRKARVFTSDVLAADGVEASVIEVAVLLVSELVTNAIHGHGMICLTVDTDARSIRIEVEEGRALPVRRRPPPVDEVAERRLLVVDEFASAWGTERRATHKLVWFEIAR